MLYRSLVRLTILPLFLFVVLGVKAQNSRDTIRFFMKNNGKIVSTKDSADYILFSMPVDSSSGEKLYPIVQYYLNGKRKLVAYTKYRFNNTALTGPYRSYYPNGNRDTYTAYQDGIVNGDQIKYFPNGNLYYVMKSDAKAKTLTYSECHDTTGRALAQNGNGKWLVYDDNYKQITETGEVKNGMKEGQWQSTDEGTKVISTFSASRLVSKKYYDENNREVPGDLIEAQFPGGMEGFAAYVKQAVRMSGEHMKHGPWGKIYVSFTINTEGKVTDVKINRGLDQELNLEVVRVFNQSRLWKPASRFGKVRSMSYVLPVMFAPKQVYVLFQPAHDVGLANVADN